MQRGTQKAGGGVELAMPRNRPALFGPARRSNVLAGLIGPLLATPAWAGDLRVVVEGIASSAGTIVAGLYDNQDSFERAVAKSSTVQVNDSRRLVGISLRPSAETQTIVFADLRPGRYSVVVFHDENDNAKLDKDVLGLPIEAYAISNNARGFLRPPAFKDAVVSIGEREEVIRVKLVYSRPQAEPLSGSGVGGESR
jgi:uncharacterized protein (DUF2141 family)